MKFNKNIFQKEKVTLIDETICFHSYRNIIYVNHPIIQNFQQMNIFIPELYYEERSINGYNIDTAPILVPNSVGGFLTSIQEEPNLLPSQPPTPNIIFRAIQHGYIVISPFIRGRTEIDKQGKFIGKAPSSIIDYKSVIRFLHYHSSDLPGDENKIISIGSSAGGCLSALLGTTGNHQDYNQYLENIGAYSARDDVFACSCYCPIMNLENADICYEWTFRNVFEYCGDVAKIEDDGNLSFQHVEGNLTKEQIEISKEESALFPIYVNNLKLLDCDKNKLELNENGEGGSFENYLEQIMIASVRKAIESGIDVSNKKWIKILNDKNEISIDLSEYAKDLKRIKPPLVFDDLNNKGSLNNLFGNKSINSRHFTSFGLSKSSNKCKAEDEIIKLMNPMCYIEDDGASKAKFWYVRHGACDNHISFVISAMFALKLQNNGENVDYELTLEMQHSDNYNFDELFSWIDKICK